MRRILIVFALLGAMFIPSAAASLDINIQPQYTEVSAGFDDIYAKLNFTTNEDIKNIKIFTDLPLQNSFSSNEFDLNNSYRAIDFSVSIPEYLSPKTYDAKFYIIYEKNIDVVKNESTNETEKILVPFSTNFGYQLKVNQTTDFNVIDYFDFNLSNDEDYNFTLVIENTGNHEYDVEIETENNDILDIDKTYTLHPGETKEYYFEGVIPLNLTPDEYYFNITYISGNVSKVTEMTFDVIDNVYPEGVVTAVDEVEIYQSFRVQAKEIKDNIEVDDFWIKVWDSDGDVTEYEHGEDDISYETKKFGEHEVTLSVNDTSGNVFIYKRIVNVTKSKILQLENEVLNLGKVKVGDKDRMFLVATLYDNIKIGVTLENVSDNSLDYYICTDVDCFDVLEGETFDVEKATYIYVHVYSNSLDKASGYLRFTAPDWIELPYNRLKFNIEFITYDIPDPIDMEMFGQYERHCWANDTGEYETSTYTCQEVYPIDVETGEMGTYVTQKMLDQYEHGQERELEVVGGTIGGQSLFIWILIIILIIGGLIAFYEIYIAPKLMVLRG